MLAVAHYGYTYYGDAGCGCIYHGPIYYLYCLYYIYYIYQVITCGYTPHPPHPKLAKTGFGALESVCYLVITPRASVLWSRCAMLPSYHP